MVAQNEKQTKTFETEIKALHAEEGERSIIARISTIAPDRDGDVLLPSGIDTTNFEKNPVVLLQHGFVDSGLPVAKALEITKSHKFITAKITFAERPESLPEGVEWIPDTLLSLFQQKVLRAFSVGFLPIERRAADQKDIDRFGDSVEQVITHWELLEFSIVSVPANQEALATAVSKGIDIGKHFASTLEIIAKRRISIVLPQKSKIKIDIVPKGVISLN